MTSPATAILQRLPPRPVLASLGAGAIALGLASGPVLEAVDAARQIAAGRERLAQAHEAVSRPAAPQPLVGADADALLSAFRARLDMLASARAALVDRVEIALDPDRPTLPRLRASLRGTEEGLHGLLHALETGGPLVSVEEAEIVVERPADPESGRPTLMRLTLTARGVLNVPPEPGAPSP